MGKFAIRAVATGYKFDLRAANGETVASSEVYATRGACRKGIAGVCRVAALAPVADLTAGDSPVCNPRFELYTDKTGAYRFRLRSRNGKIIAASESYTTRAACENGIDSVRKNATASE